MPADLTGKENKSIMSFTALNSNKAKEKIFKYRFFTSNLDFFFLRLKFSNLTFLNFQKHFELKLNV